MSVDDTEADERASGNPGDTGDTGPTTARRGFLSRVLSALAWTLLVPTSILASTALHIDRPVMREATRVTTNELVSTLMLGRLHIGVVESVSLWNITARDVTLYDPAGRAVIHGDRIDLVPDLGAAMRGVLRFSHAHLIGGELTLIEGASGLPTFLEAFEPPPDDAPSEGEPFHAIVDDMHLEGVTITGELLGVQGLRIEDARAHGRMEFEHETVIEIFSVTGRLLEPWPFEAEIDSVYARIDSAPHIGTRLHATLHTDTDRAGVNLTYAVPESQPVDAEPELDILIRVDPARASRLYELGFDWAELLQGELDGHVRLHGPPEDLNIRAWLDTDGGQVGLTGRLPSQGDLEVVAYSDDVLLSEVIVGAPAIHLHGRAQLVQHGDDIQVSLESEAFDLGGLPIPASQLHASLQDDGVVLRDSLLILSGGEARVSGRVGFDGDINLVVEAELANIADEPFLAELVPGARGAASFVGRIQLSPEDILDATGRWVFRNLRYGPVALARLVAVGSVDGTSAQPRVHLSLDAQNLRVSDVSFGSGRGRIDGGPRRFRTSVSLNHPNRNVSFEANLDRQGSTLVASVPALAVAGHRQRWVGTLARLVFRPGGMSLERGALAHDDQRLLVSGQWGFATHTNDELFLEASQVAMGNLLRWVPDSPPIRGVVDGDVHVLGDFEGQPAFEVDVQVGGLAFGEVDGFDGAILSRFIPGETVGAASLEAELVHPDRGALDLSLTGQVYSGDPLLTALEYGAYEGTIDVRNLDLSLVNELNTSSPPLVGRGTGQIIGSGSPDLFDFEGELTSPSLAVGTFPPLTVETHVSFREGVLIGRVITLDAAGEFIEAEASTVLDIATAIANPDLLVLMLENAPWRAALRMPPRDLGLLPEPLRVIVPDADLLRGAASLTMRGGAFEPRADLIADLEWIGSLGDIRCGTDAAPRLTLRGKIRGNEIRLEAQGLVADRRVLEAEAVANAPVSQWFADPEHFELPPTRVDATVTRAPLSDIPFACEYGGGDINMRVVAEDVFTEDPRLEIDLGGERVVAHRLDLIGADGEEELVVARVSPEFAVRGRASLDGHTLRGELDADWWNGGTTQANASLVLGDFLDFELSGEERVDADANLSETPLEAMLLWLPGFGDVRGTADGSVSARGPLNSAELSGAVDLSHGQVELESLGQRLDDVSGTLLLEGDRITLQGIRAQDGDGVARIAGEVGMEGVFPDRLELELATDEFPVRQEGSIIARLTGQATLDAEIGGGAMDGELKVNELVVRLPDSGGRSPMDLSPHPEIHVTGEGPPARPEDPYELRLHVDATDPFTLRGQDLAAQVSAQLDVLYRTPDFRVEGGVELRSGHFDVFGKRFDVEGGWLRFDASEELDPLVNLVAVHSLRSRPGETVTVTASGRLSSPVIRFASSLTTDRAQIIALLVSGNVRQDSELEASRQAADFLAGIASGVLTLSLREEFGSYFPAIAVESNSLGGTRIRGGINFEDLLPEVIRNVIQGAYFEGFLNTAGQSGTAATGQVQDIGVRLEVDFPRGIQNSYTFGGPSSWSIDLTWQP